MDFELDAGQRAWLTEIREFLRDNVTPELLDELAEHDLEFPDGEVVRFRRKIGAKGWFGLNWPREYGGLGLGAIHLHLLMSEFEYWGVPGPDLTVTSVAPMIMRHGTERNKTEWLPLIARGEMICAVGYSEPEAGTDLASLRTTATRDGEEWVINGTKIWNSGAQRATHEWLCVRTDPSGARHRGISVIIVPDRQPGRRNPPAVRMVGLSHQRGALPRRAGAGHQPGRRGQPRLDLHHRCARSRTRGADQRRRPAPRGRASCTSWRKGRGATGPCPPTIPSLRRRLVQAEADVAVATLMGYEAASILDSGVIPSVEVSVEKVFTSELRQRIADLALDILGPDGLLAHRSERAPLAGKFERLYRAAPLMRFGGGTNEVLRDIIAQRGHAMPSYGR